MSKPPLSRFEFVALMAMMFATVAFSIDAMLPGLPEIGATLSPEAPNRAQLIVTSFVLGMGLATFVIGPLSDAYGRRPVLLAGAGLYIVAAALAWAAQSLEVVLAARVLQGVGAAGPRIVAMAIIRDLYSGRQMARIMSLTMMVFTLVPAISPLLGAYLIGLWGWKSIFVAFIVFALISAGWLALRQPELLPPARRQPMRLAVMIAGMGQMFAHPTVRLAILAQAFCYAMLFMMISLVQPVYDQVFDANDSFPMWFAVVSMVAASASLLNALLVVRLGMRRLASIAFAGQALCSAAVTLLWLVAPDNSAMFAVFIFWQASVFFITGLTIGNLNAIAMEPMGHIAGMAASVIGSVATVAGAVFAMPVGLVFDGTLLPLSAGLTAVNLGAWATLVFMRRVEQRLGLR